MPLFIASAICVCAFILAFFHSRLAWLPLVVEAGYLAVTLYQVKRSEWPHVDVLSAEANSLMQKHGHFYAWPLTCQGYSAAASGVQLGAVSVGIVNAFHGFWWGLLFAAIFWVLMALVASAFNPTHFLGDPVQKRAHQEALEWSLKVTEPMRRALLEQIDKASRDGQK